MNAELESWLEERLKKGVRLEGLFPYEYDIKTGFGYRVIFIKDGKQYNVIITASKISFSQEVTFFTFSSVSHYTRHGEEQLSSTKLIGKKLVLTPEKYNNGAFHTCAINGVLTLQEEAL